MPKRKRSGAVIRRLTRKQMQMRRPSSRRFRRVVRSTAKSWRFMRGNLAKRYLTGFPPVLLFKMKYKDRHLMTAQILPYARTSQIYRLNSIYDPDFTGTGLQPAFHDDLQLIYRRYYVVGCKVNFKFTLDKVTDPTVTPVLLTMHAGRSDASFGSVTNPMDRAMCPHTWQHVLRSADAGAASASIYSWSKYFKIKDLYAGEPDPTDELGASFGANPTRQAYFYLYAEDYGNLSGGIGVGNEFSGIAEFTLTYYVRCLDPLMTGYVRD